MKGIFALFVLCLSFNATADDRALDDALATLEKSKSTRKQIAKTLPQRDLASLKQEEMALAQEFHDLMNNDEDKAYFEEIDNLIE